VEVDAVHVYEQSTGRWEHDGQLVAVCYSGTDDGDGVREPGEGLNDPAAQELRGIGPIPVGRYLIGLPFTHPTAGPLVMRLTPFAGTNTFGRDGFLIHGDSKSAPGTASHGCVVMPHDPRAHVAELVEHGDRLLTVVP
jgi:hypothetical protein